MEKLFIEMWGFTGSSKGTVTHPGTQAAGSLCHLRPEEPSSLAVVPGFGNTAAAGEGRVTGTVASGEEGGPLLPCNKARREPRRLNLQYFFLFFRHR